MRSNSCSYWTTLIYMLSVTDFNPKGTISEVRNHGGAKFGHAGRWSFAKCRFSTKGSFDHHGKAEKKNVQKELRKWKNLNILGDLWKRWWIRYRLHMWGWLCEKLKTWRRQDSMVESLPGVFSSECPQEHTACTDLFCRSGEGRGRLIIRSH